MKKKTAVVLGVVGLVVVGGALSGNDDTSAAKPKAAASTTSATKAAEKPKATEKAKPKAAKVVTFRVWGKAPAGALGPLDITYGSDSDSRKGHFRNGEFKATLPLTRDAMYFNVTAQLQGSGDIQCSVTVGGETKKGHASGDYNICDAQLSSGFFGDWE